MPASPPSTFLLRGLGPRASQGILSPRPGGCLAAWQRAPLECAQLALGSCLTQHKTFGFHGLEICFQSEE